MPTKRYKLPDGTRVPGTTTVIGTSLGWGKEALMAWAHKLGLDGKDFREERDKAANAGTIAHALAAADITGELLSAEGLSGDADVVESAKAGFKAYLRWKERSKLELLHSEISFVHEKHRYGGTLDAVARFEGQTELIDFKHTNSLHPENIIQVAAYKRLWEEGIPFQNDAAPLRDPISGIHLLRFGKRGDFHHSYYEAPRMGVPWMAFLRLRDLYDMKKAIEEMC